VSNPLQDAVGIINALLAWKPDDLPAEELPQEWIDAEEFVERYGGDL
jgi:hypothetical protein